MKKILLLLVGFLLVVPLASQEVTSHIQKRYNIFFRINSPVIDEDFKGNAETLAKMRADIDTTLMIDGAVPDSLLILSTASPDGGYEFNRRLAMNRAASTEKLLLDMFPQFKDSHIKVEFLEEDWDGLLQVLKDHEDFPQRDEMLAIIYDKSDVQSKEYRLRACKKGWRHLVNHHIYALRNSSITISVVMTESNSKDIYTRQTPIAPVKPLSYTPKYEMQLTSISPEQKWDEPTWRKTILAARSNLLVPGLNVGLEFPIRQNWSVGVDYYYPWAVSKGNRWCGEMLGLFVDAKYWFPGKKNEWQDDSKLKGHAVGLYAGAGYYDYQNIRRGAQGEYIDFGVDYTYALPVANDHLRLEFNVGLGFIRTWYRPYNPSTDFEDLIKEPGVKYRATNFVGPTRASISLVYPISFKTRHPVLKMRDKAKRKGGEE